MTGIKVRPRWVSLRLTACSLTLLGITLLCACSGGGSSSDDAAVEVLTDAEAARVRQQALTDAARVADTDPRRMEREGAILDIRAKEQALRSAGYKAAADLYIAVADSVLEIN